MAARATLAWIISEVRLLIDDKNSTYFTDVQIQNDLETTMLPHNDRELLMRNRDDTVYESRYRDFEGVVDDETGSWSGDPTIAIWNSYGPGGTEIDPDSWSLRNGLFVYDDPQDRNLWLDSYVYDPKLAASNLCKKLSAKRSITPGVGETGGAIMGRFELRQLAREYRQDSKSRRARMRRRIRRTRWVGRY